MVERPPLPSRPTNDTIVDISPPLEPMSIQEAPEEDNLSDSPRNVRFYIAVAVTVLALICIFAGMIANEGEPWRTIFFAICVSWSVLMVLGVVIDVQGLSSQEMSMQILSHVLCCMAMLTIVIKVLQLPPESLQQWLPAIVTAAIAVSKGLPSMSPPSRRELGAWVASLLGIGVPGQTEDTAPAD